MEQWTRRQWLTTIGAGAIVASRSAAGEPAVAAPAAQQASPRRLLDITEFQPRSMLHVTETKVDRARFPVIDVHTHLGWSARSEKGVWLGEKMEFLTTPEVVLKAAEARNLKAVVNLTGGYGQGLLDTLARFDRAHPGKFLSLTEPCWERIAEPGYPALQADLIERAHQAGAKGLKVTKTLGLYLREQVTSGPLIKIDDRRLDAMWDACGSLNMPVAIHIADPEAFFLPVDRLNERFEELNNHPDWSFHGADFPAFDDLIRAFYRVVGRHPRTQFLALHVAHDSENLASVSDYLDRYKNVHVEIGARIGELGRQPRACRAFFERHQDRIMFGTDTVPHGDPRQQAFGGRMYEIYFRFLETLDEYFDYSPSAVPPQGRWRIYGLGLPDTILRKVYHENAERLLGLSA